MTLKHAKGSITTKTPISFTEPISIESISPLEARPGDEITIAGDYLNLIHEVIFSKDVAVSEDDFLAQSRSEIKLVVPAEAQSGKIILSDAAEEMPNWIYSDEELTVVLPAVEKVLDLTDVKPGNTVTVTGTDLSLATRIVMPNGDDVEFSVNDEGTELTFVLPANVSDGTIRMIPHRRRGSRSHNRCRSA